MRSITVSVAGGTYSIHIGAGLLGRLAGYVAPLAPTSVLVVTNEVVAPLHGDAALAALRDVARTALLSLPDGEGTKRWDSVARILDALVAHGADRKSVVVALGGGVVGDLAGFAASIYMRGIRVVQVPTTLLAQVDSSVGGKTGINHPSGKNLIGTFHQPSVVVADTDVLQTLPSRELAAGLAEILKHGLLADANYFEEVVADLPALRERAPAALARAIGRSCEIKAGVVGRDEREAGERALLNLGHTFGHATVPGARHKARGRCRPLPESPGEQRVANDLVGDRPLGGAADRLQHDVANGPGFCLLVAAHAPQRVVGAESLDPRRQPGERDGVLHCPDIALRDQTEALRHVGRQHHSASDRLAVQPLRIARKRLDRVPERVSEIQQRALP